MSSLTRLRFGLFGALVILAMIASACQPSPTAVPSTPVPQATTGQQPTAPPPTQPPATQPPPAQPKVVTISFTQEPDSLSPLYSTMYFHAILRDFFLLGMWNIDDKGEAVPQIAAEMPSFDNGGISADGKTFTVKLRPDAQWSDGTPITPDDLKFTFEMVVSKKNTVSNTYPYEEFVDSVEAKDEHTAVIQLKKPLASWRTSLFIYLLPKHILQPVFDKDGTLDNADWNRAPTVGVGPYVFKEWVAGTHISFERNPNFWAPPKIDRIFVRIVPDDAAQINALKAGDADIGVFISPSDVPTLQALGTLDVPTVQSGYDEGWYFNVGPTAHPAMQDVRVRRALVMAIDREKITKDLLFGITTPGVTYWDTTPPFADATLKPIPYDPAGAKALLDEAGWKDTNGDGVRDKDGKDLKLRYITNTRDIRKSVQAVTQQMLKAVGIEVELLNEDSNIFWNSYGQGGTMATGQYDIGEYSNNTLFPDPDTSQWLCSEIPTAENPEGGNWNYYCNKQLDALFQQQASELDLQKRVEIFKQIEKILDDAVIWVNMWRDPDIWAVNKRLTGLALSGANPFWNCSTWDIRQ